MSDDIITIHNDTDGDAKFSRMFWDWYVPRFGLPIVVKIGEAQNEYAEQMRKTAEQLTTEEKQMAILNKILSASESPGGDG